MNKKFAIVMALFMTLAGCMESIEEEIKEIIVIPGCNDSSAFNYDENATNSDACLTELALEQAIMNFMTTIEQGPTDANSSMGMTISSSTIDGTETSVEMVFSPGGIAMFTSMISEIDLSLIMDTGNSTDTMMPFNYLSEQTLIPNPDGTDTTVIHMVHMDESQEFTMNNAVSWSAIVAEMMADDDDGMDGDHSDMDGDHDGNSDGMGMGLEMETPEGEDILSGFDVANSTYALTLSSDSGYSFTSTMLERGETETGATTDFTTTFTFILDSNFVVTSISSESIIACSLCTGVLTDTMTVKLLSDTEISGYFDADWSSVATEALPFAVTPMDGHDGHDDGDHDGHGDEMVCYDMSTHAVDDSYDNQADCEAAGLMWTTASGGHDGHDDGDDNDNVDWESYIGGYCEWEGNPDEEEVEVWSCKDDESDSDWGTWWYYCELHGEDWHCTDDFGQSSNWENSADLNEYDAHAGHDHGDHSGDGHDDDDDDDLITPEQLLADIDSDESGTMSLDEFNAFFGDSDEIDVNDPEFSEIFEYNDADASGDLDDSELEGFIMDIDAYLEGGHDEEDHDDHGDDDMLSEEDMFEMGDVNDDGFINMSEMEDLFSGDHDDHDDDTEPPTPEEAMENDTDSSGGISWSEFYDAWEVSNAEDVADGEENMSMVDDPVLESDLHQAFNDSDIDGDGELNLTELQTFIDELEHMFGSDDDDHEERTFHCSSTVGGTPDTEIPFSQVNDGTEDCGDGSDEPQDTDGDGTIDNWFDCVDGSNVSMELVNDGNDDCPDGDDESHDHDDHDDDSDMGSIMMYFNASDADGDGLLSAEEFTTFYENLNNAGSPSPEVLFSMMDSNGDGMITGTEYGEWWNSSSVDSEPMSENDWNTFVYSLFIYEDSDDDGQWDFDEFLSWYGENMDHEDDHDGHDHGDGGHDDDDDDHDGHDHGDDGHDDGDHDDHDGHDHGDHDGHMHGPLDWLIVEPDSMTDMPLMAGDLSNYYAVLSKCTISDDSEDGSSDDDDMMMDMMGGAPEMECGPDIMFTPLSSASNPDSIYFHDADNSGTLTYGDMVHVNENATSEEWTHVRLYSASADSYSDENPMMTPGFTGVIGMIALLGAALLTRRD